MSRVLVVDDSSFAAETIVEQFLELGHQAVLGVDGEDGWNRFCEQRFDLVITDVRMPKLDGPGLIARIRASGSRVPILVETSDLGGEGVARAEAAGASACFEFTDFVRRLPGILAEWLPKD